MSKTTLKAILLVASAAALSSGFDERLTSS